MKLLSAISLVLWSYLVYNVQQNGAHHLQPSLLSTPPPTPDSTSPPTPDSSLTTSDRPARKASSDAARSLPDHQVPRSAGTLMTKIAALTDRVNSLEKKLNAQREHRAGFHVDLGLKPYGSYNASKWRPVQFNRVLTNVGNGYDQKTGIFTAPFSGLYIFHLHFIGGLHKQKTELAIFAAGEAMAVAYADGYDVDTNDQGSCTAVVDLLMGEKASVKLYFGNPLLWASNLVSFSGVLVHSN